jgi:hypothetical protein
MTALVFVYDANKEYRKYSHTHTEKQKYLSNKNANNPTKRTNIYKQETKKTIYMGRETSS